MTKAPYRNANGATLRLTESVSAVAADKVMWSELRWKTPETCGKPLDLRDASDHGRFPRPSLRYSCHTRGNGCTALRNILSAARAEEAQKAADQKK